MAAHEKLMVQTGSGGTVSAMVVPLSADRVAIIGDTHGDITWTSKVVRLAAGDGVHHLLQVGDFGFWPRSSAGAHYLDELNLVLADSGSTLWFLRGNHEDQEALLDLTVEEDGLVRVRDHIRFMGDGTLIDWDVHRVLIVGGAPSVDAEDRTPGFDWFPGETLSLEGYDLAMASGRVDMVLSHDAPSSIDLGPMSYWEPGAFHRSILERIAAQAEPLLWVHGHYHRRRSGRVDEWGRACRTESLDCNKSNGAVIYVQRDRLSAEAPVGWPDLVPPGGGAKARP